MSRLLAKNCMMGLSWNFVGVILVICTLCPTIRLRSACCEFSRYFRLKFQNCKIPIFWYFKRKYLENLRRADLSRMVGHKVHITRITPTKFQLAPHMGFFASNHNSFFLLHKIKHCFLYKKINRESEHP